MTTAKEGDGFARMFATGILVSVSVAVLGSLALVMQVTATTTQKGGLAAVAVLDPVERQLSSGATGLLRTIRRVLRRGGRFMAWSAKRWTTWLATGVGLTMVAFLAPLLGWAPVRAWRTEGFPAFRTLIGLALAVYVRLLIDRRAPALGKILLASGVVYGVVPRDLVPDGLRPTGTGLIDDLVAVIVVSRCFMRLCPDRLVEQHAVQATRARHRRLK